MPSPFIPTRQNLVSKIIGHAPSRRRFAFHRAKATVAANSLAWALFVADVGIGYRVAKSASMVSPKSDWRGLGCCPSKGRGRNLDTTKVLSGSAGWSPRVIPLACAAPSPGRGSERRAKQGPTLAPLLREVILRSSDLIADGLRQRDRGSLARGYLSLDPFNHLHVVTIVIPNKAQRKHRSFDG